MGLIGRPSEGNFEKMIKYMSIGEKGYIPPSAIEFDLKYNPYLNIREVFAKRRTSTFKVPISRSGPGLAEYCITIKGVKYNWKVSENPFLEGENKDLSAEVVPLSYVGLLDQSPNKKISLKEKLESKMKRAIKDEDYETAAKIRDKIKMLEKN